MRVSQRIYIGTFLLFAVAFLISLPFKPYAGSWVIKEIPDIALALFALASVTGLRGKLLFLALLLSAGGGVVLEVAGGTHFVLGLALFLLAHITYIATFSMEFGPRKSRLPVAILLALYSVAIALFLRPGLGAMALPVYCYIAAITTMGILAALRKPAGSFVLCGAILFMLSDSLIAVNKFRTPIPAEDYLVMITYYAAQFLIVWGFAAGVRSKPAE